MSEEKFVFKQLYNGIIKASWLYYFVPLIFVVFSDYNIDFEQSCRYIPVYIILSYLLVCLSFTLVDPLLAIKLLDVKRIVNVLSKNSAVVERQFKTAIAEEILFRLLPLILVDFILTSEYSQVFVLMVINFIFTFLHLRKRKHLDVYYLIEFFFFFLFVSILYVFWTDFLMITIIHFIRNILIYFTSISFKRKA